MESVFTKKTDDSGVNQGTPIKSKCLDLQGRQIKLGSWFNRVLTETRWEDIFEDKTSIATLETVETLCPRLPPSEEGSEIEKNMAEVQQEGETP